MRNRINVIQINGIKGILFLIGAAICFVAGFVVFPGIVLKMGWNFVSDMTGFMPIIGLTQGMLLWAIVCVSYLTFKGKGFFVEFKSAESLNAAEMDAVMQKIRTERQKDIIEKSILRAKELEIAAKNELDKFEKEQEEPKKESEVDKFLS